MSAAPKLARAVFDFVSVAPRKIERVEDWGRRQKYKPADVTEALSWLEEQGLIECAIKGSDDWATVKPGAKPPEGEPAAKTRPHTDEDNADDEDSEADDEDDSEDEDDDQEADEDEAPESEEQPKAAPRWQPALEQYLLGAVRTRSEIARWAAARQLVWDDVRKVCEAWQAEGRLTLDGRAMGTRYCLDGAKLYRNGERPAKAAPAAPAPQPEAPAPAAAPRSPADILLALVALPVAETDRLLVQVERVRGLRARVEQLEAELVVARVELAAALRGEGPATAPSAPEPAPVAAPEAAPAARAPRAAKAGRSRYGDGPSLDERALAAFRQGECLKASDVARRTGIEQGPIWDSLARLARAGRLVRPNRGVYALPAKAKRRAA